MNDITASIIVEAANIPMREEIEKKLHDKGILIVPDVIANAGGVISSYAEYRGYNPKRMFDTVKKKITEANRLVLGESIEKKAYPRKIAMDIAQRLVEKEMKQ